MENVIIPTRDVIEPHLPQWSQMPPPLGLGPVITALVQIIFNGNNAGDQCRADFRNLEVMDMFMEFLITPHLHKYLHDTYSAEQIENWYRALFIAVPALANQLVTMCPTIVNSIAGSSYVSAVGYAEMRGLDTMLFVETFDMGTRYGRQFAAG